MGTAEPLDHASMVLGSVQPHSSAIPSDIYLASTLTYMYVNVPCYSLVFSLVYGKLGHDALCDCVISARVGAVSKVAV